MKTTIESLESWELVGANYIQWRKCFSIFKLYGFVVKSLAVKHFLWIHNCLQFRLQLLSNLPTAKSTFFHLCIWIILWQVTYNEAQYSKTLGSFVIVKRTNYLYRNKSQRSHHYLCELVSLAFRYRVGTVWEDNHLNPTSWMILAHTGGSNWVPLTMSRLPPPPTPTPPCFRIRGAEDNFIFYIEYCFFLFQWWN